MRYALVAISGVERFEQCRQTKDVYDIGRDGREQLMPVRQGEQVNDGLCGGRARRMRVFDHLPQGRILRDVGISSARETRMKQDVRDMVPLPSA